MKIIHCADIHLGSSLTNNFNREQAKERQNEILSTFIKMIEYADENDVKAVIIAGDLFDKDNGIKTVKTNVFKAFAKYSNIDFYYLKGNHDSLIEVEDIPENLHFFNNEWTTYSLDDNQTIKLTGVELGKTNSDYIYNALNLKETDFNIVTLHGQESIYDRKDDAEIVNLKELRGKNIDYLALGHIHSYKKENLDARCTYCYSGCLEGRGFDEPGKHGFVLLKIDENKKTYTSDYIDFAQNLIFHEDVDISGSESSFDAADKVKEIIKNLGCTRKDYAEFILKGDVPLNSDIDAETVRSQVSHLLKYVKVKDKTSIEIKISDYENDESLKGEFVRTVSKNSKLNEETKKLIIKCGLDALSGKEF